jgi:hypothetical protein
LVQLNDEKADVQGNAIRCLSKIMVKLPVQQVEEVATTMIRKVISESEDKIELRDVYATCVKTLI